MTHPRRFTEEYLWVHRNLTPGERMRLAVVEDEISEDPEPPHQGRFEVGGYIYATKADGFIIKYRLRDSGWVSFEQLLDLRNPAQSPATQ